MTRIVPILLAVIAEPVLEARGESGLGDQQREAEEVGVDLGRVAVGDGRGLVAAIALGGAGIAMGTRFLLTKESQVPEHVKEIYLETKASRSGHWIDFAGKPHLVEQSDPVVVEGMKRDD